MSQTARKPVQHTARRHSQTSLHDIGIVQKAENDVFEMGRGTMENTMEGIDAFNHMAMQCAGIGCDNMDATAESASQAMRSWIKAGNAMLAQSHCLFAQYVADSKEASVCQSPTDFWELQTIAAQQAVSATFDNACCLFGTMFDSYIEALEPMCQRTAAASKQFRKVCAQ